MRKIRVFWRGVYDVRPGEGVRTLCMALHMTCVLFAYYILKPLSRALFLSKFDLDQLPFLYILIAAFGGMLAFWYTKVAVRSSLAVAVNRATAFWVACLLAIWWLLRFNLPWMLYVFNVWVSLFSIVTVSQAWLIAANVFNPRQAKRLYGLLGLSAVAGAAFGGGFTALLAQVVNPHNLLIATAGMVLLSYLFFRIVAAQKNVNLYAAQAAGAEEEFAFRDILGGIARNRHLQVIMGIITITFIVDVVVEFQFSAIAKASFSDQKDLTSFLASFYGPYLSLITFVMQFFLTSLVVRYIGVGGTLQVMPVVIGTASCLTIFLPHLGTRAALRLSEAATRYSFNRTGMELLYLPLPIELRNRTKAFVDIFMDRFGRGLGAMVLLGYTAFIETDPKHPNLTRVSALILFLSICWIVLSARVGREYRATIRQRVESRRLEFADERISVAGAETVELLEKTVAEGTPRQAAYALSLLSEVPDYDVAPHVDALARHPAEECRSRAFQVAAAAGYGGIVNAALRSLASWGEAREQQAALEYLVAIAPDGPVTPAWIATEAACPVPWRRTLAAYAVGLRNSDPASVLPRLLEDADPAVASAACRSAGKLAGRMYFDALVRRLGDHAVRGAAIESLALFGVRICGSLGDILADPYAPVTVRRQVPRVLRLIPSPRSVEVLATFLATPDPVLRTAVIKALNRLRADDPSLAPPAATVHREIRSEVREGFRLHALAAPLRHAPRPRSATALLVRTLDDRFHNSRERVFRLLGLVYSAQEVHSTWLAHESGKPDRVTAAHEYLDNLMDREGKQVVMPLLDSTSQLSLHGRDLYEIEFPTPEDAVRELLASRDSWLTACAIAVAAEMKLTSLGSAIAKAAEAGENHTAEVARSAAAALGSG